MELINIVKSELIHETWKMLNGKYNKNDVENIINAFVKAVANGIKSGYKVKVGGLGTFSTFIKNIYIKKDINGNSPNIIQSVKCVSFKPSKKLKINKEIY